MNSVSGQKLGIKTTESARMETSTVRRENLKELEVQAVSTFYKLWSETEKMASRQALEINDISETEDWDAETEREENLALGRPAWQQNVIPNQSTTWGAAKAVDGKYSDRSSAGNQCTISASGYNTATWRVDLQRVVSISHINIYYRTDNFPSPSGYVSRFAGFFLYVSKTTSREDGRLCFHELQNVSGTPTEDQRINCSVYGRYVIYYNERRPDVTYPSYYSEDAFNELCEVEVYGCPGSKYYGKYCDQLCPEMCLDQRCNISSGNCLECIPGYKGPRCSQKCDGGVFGLKCSQSCGQCRDGSQCHHINGTCLDGCSPGYRGSLCING
ncbi:uncharacterized protein LOC133180118 [Saccostrea echinata]|uniref:uncharacterized protein LOC133180118 n=1 Tax=Saccostrea echinata TaxID=191078 RepID=UPI002A80C564|nr:uncharacterized protein LOC133180118 [Saccostrea echinata]